VFVVHGRNEKIRTGLFSFLRAINLRPIEWSQAVQATKSGSPYIGDILQTSFEEAQAFVVLLTPDDLVCLRPFLQADNDDDERQWAGQARPNVLFEAGMALGYDASRTIIVEVGRIKRFSDIAGRHVVRLNNSMKQRQELARRLEQAGCRVDLGGTDWHNEGDFSLDTPIEDPVREHGVAVEGQLAALELRFGNAVSEAKVAKTYITHIVDFIYEIRSAWASKRPDDAIRRLEHLRHAIFDAIIQGARSEKAEHVWCAFFTPEDRGRNKYLRAQPEHHSGHTSAIENHPLVRSKKSLAGAAYVTGQSVYSAHAEKDPRFQRLGVAELDNIVSIVCVPAYPLGAKPGATPRGVLSVSSNLPGKIDETDRGFAAICADALVLIEELLDEIKAVAR
jgi:hypothetical protein